MARLRDILRGWGPADPPNILKRDSMIHKTENGAQLRVLDCVQPKSPNLLGVVVCKSSY